MFEDGMFWAAFGAAWVFGCAIVLIVIWHLRSKQRMEKAAMIHQERLKAIDKGVPLPEFPDLSEEAKMEQFNRIFTPPTVNPKWPLGIGLLLITGGIGFWFAMQLDSNAYTTGSEGFIGVFVGIGFMLYYRLTRSTEK